MKSIITRIKTYIQTSELCKKYDIISWVWYERRSCLINTNSDVHLDRLNLNTIPLSFYHINGYFNCSVNLLTSLKGCPKYVGGDFSCAGNNITSLEYCPEHIYGSFNCSNDMLLSLEYFPKYIKNDFIYFGNTLNRHYITSLNTIYGKIYTNQKWRF